MELFTESLTGARIQGVCEGTPLAWRTPSQGLKFIYTGRLSPPDPLGGGAGVFCCTIKGVMLHHQGCFAAPSMGFLLHHQCTPQPGTRRPDGGLIQPPRGRGGESPPVLLLLYYIMNVTTVCLLMYYVVFLLRAYFHIGIQ